MNLPHVQFTIRTGMIVVAATAVLLVTSSLWLPLPCLLAFPFVAPFGSRWLVSRGYRRAAGKGFWGLAVLINALLAVACTYPDYMFLPALFIASLFIVVPTLAGLGVAWAMLATREGAILRRSSSRAGLSVFAVTVLPLATVTTLWPLRLAFLASRPTLDLLADRVAAGQPVSFPQRAGVFWFVESRIDASTGNVGLVIDPNPGGPTGFVRMGAQQNGAGPFGASGLGVDLGWGWEYRQED